MKNFNEKLCKFIMGYNEGPSKEAIQEFITKYTEEKLKKVKRERIAYDMLINRPNSYSSRSSSSYNGDIDYVKYSEDYDDIIRLNSPRKNSRIGSINSARSEEIRSRKSSANTNTQQDTVIEKRNQEKNINFSYNNKKKHLGILWEMDSENIIEEGNLLTIIIIILRRILIYFVL